MKKLFCICLSVCLLAGMLASCGASGKPDETLPAEMAIKLGETGVTVTLPTEMGFEQRESDLNDYFGVAASGEWSIIVNSDEKSGYSLEEYADLTAKANDASRAIKGADGNYYFTYNNEGYSFYTAVRENGDLYYRVAFYCFGDLWNQYSNSFEQWATTIEFTK